MVENMQFEPYDDFLYFKVVMEMSLVEGKDFHKIKEINKILHINKELNLKTHAKSMQN